MLVLLDDDILRVNVEGRLAQLGTDGAATGHAIGAARAAVGAAGALLVLRGGVGLVKHVLGPPPPVAPKEHNAGDPQRDQHQRAHDGACNHAGGQRVPCAEHAAGMIGFV